jgi:hypothetical protein
MRHRAAVRGALGEREHTLEKLPFLASKSWKTGREREKSLSPSSIAIDHTSFPSLPTHKKRTSNPHTHKHIYGESGLLIP